MIEIEFNFTKAFIRKLIIECLLGLQKFNRKFKVNPEKVCFISFIIPDYLFISQKNHLIFPNIYAKIL